MRIGLDHLPSSSAEQEAGGRVVKIMEHGLGSQTSLNLSPASVIYWVVLLKLTFRQVPHLQNKNDSTSDTVVMKIN